MKMCVTSDAARCLRCASHASPCNRLQVRARFVVQLREPVARHVSYIKMEIREGRLSDSMDIFTSEQLFVWSNHMSNHRQQLSSIEYLLPRLRLCNERHGELAKPSCIVMGLQAAEIASEMLAGCRILSYEGAGVNRSFSVAQGVPSAGTCTQFNYPHVRSQATISYHSLGLFARAALLHVPHSLALG